MVERSQELSIIGAQKRRTRRTIREIYSTQEAQLALASAISAHDPSENNRRLTGYLVDVYFDQGEKKWLTGRKPGVKRTFPFATLAARIKSKEITVTGETSPFSLDLQQVITTSFPQNILPIAEVEYTKMPVEVRFNHPQFQKELREAVDAHDPKTSKYHHFWTWFSAVRFDEEFSVWREGELREGKWANIASCYESHDGTGKKQAFEKRVKEMDELISLDLIVSLTEKFPAEFELDPARIPYQLLPLDERLAHKTFQTAFLQALNAYEAVPLDKRVSFNSWYHTVLFNEASGQWELGTSYKGPWKWLEKYDFFGALHAKESVISEQVRTRLLELFPNDLLPFEQRNYLTIPTVEWFSHPVFQQQLRYALMKTPPFPEGKQINLIPWLKTVRPRSTVVWDRKLAREYQENSGPWKQLAQYCESYKTKQDGDWRDLFMDGNLPEHIKLLLVTRFPQHFLQRYALTQTQIQSLTEYLTDYTHNRILAEQDKRSAVPDLVSLYPKEKIEKGARRISGQENRHRKKRIRDRETRQQKRELRRSLTNEITHYTHVKAFKNFEEAHAAAAAAVPYLIFLSPVEKQDKVQRRISAWEERRMKKHERDRRQREAKHNLLDQFNYFLAQQEHVKADAWRSGVLLLTGGLLLYRNEIPVLVPTIFPEYQTKENQKLLQDMLNRDIHAPVKYYPDPFTHFLIEETAVAHYIKGKGKNVIEGVRKNWQTVIKILSPSLHNLTQQDWEQLVILTKRQKTAISLQQIFSEIALIEKSETQHDSLQDKETRAYLTAYASRFARDIWEPYQERQSILLERHKATDAYHPPEVTEELLRGLIRAALPDNPPTRVVKGIGNVHIDIIYREILSEINRLRVKKRKRQNKVD